jgi:hypothetical protein
MGSRIEVGCKLSTTSLEAERQLEFVRTSTPSEKWISRCSPALG